MDVQPTRVQLQIPIPSEKAPKYKSFTHIILIAMNLSLANFYFGYSLVYISTLEFQTIMNIFNITFTPDIAKGILTGCIPIGAGIGALLGEKLIHLFTRRKFVLLINATAIIAGSLIFITKMEVLITMRLIQGICVGLYTAIIPLYITQISPVEITGFTGPLTQIFCSLGTTIAYLFYYILSITISRQNIWYFVFGFSLIPLLLQTIVLLFVFPYETPKYFLMHNQKKKARALIQHLYKSEYVQTIFHQKIQDLELGKTKQQMKTKIKEEAGKQGVPIPTLRMASKVSVSSALSGVEMRQPHTSGIAIFASIHIMILRQFCGINAVVAYGGDIIKQVVPSMRAVVPIILNFEVFLGAFAAIFVFHKIGKKTLLQGGTLMLAFSLVFITSGFFIHQSVKSASVVLIIFGLIIFNFTFGLTFGAIIWSYVSQIVEPSYTIFATMVTWIFASLVIVLFPILKTLFPGGNPAVLFLFFCIWTSSSFVVNHFVLVETKGKRQHQIHDQYSQIKLCKCYEKRKAGNQMTQSQILDLDSLNLRPAQTRFKPLQKIETKNKNISLQVVLKGLSFNKKRQNQIQIIDSSNKLQSQNQFKKQQTVNQMMKQQSKQGQNLQNQISYCQKSTNQAQTTIDQFNSGQIQQKNQSK